MKERNEMEMTREFLSKDIGLSPEHVELVKFMLRFKRSVLLVAGTTNATKLATAAYDRRGAVTWVNAGMLEHLQHHLRRRRADSL